VDLLKAKQLYSQIISNHNRRRINGEVGADNVDDGAFVDALFELSKLLEQDGDMEEGEESAQLHDISFDLLVKAAEEGHSAAQHELAAAYNTGIQSGLVPIDTGRWVMGCGYRYCGVCVYHALVCKY
jgi:TPR repeat protein